MSVLNNILKIFGWKLPAKPAKPMVRPPAPPTEPPKPEPPSVTPTTFSVPFKLVKSGVPASFGVPVPETLDITKLRVKTADNKPAISRISKLTKDFALVDVVSDLSDLKIVESSDPNLDGGLAYQIQSMDLFLGSSELKVVTTENSPVCFKLITAGSHVIRDLTLYVNDSPVHIMSTLVLDRTDVKQTILQTAAHKGLEIEILWTLFSGGKYLKGELSVTNGGGSVSSYNREDFQIKNIYLQGLHVSNIESTISTIGTVTKDTPEYQHVNFGGLEIGLPYFHQNYPMSVGLSNGVVRIDFLSNDTLFGKQEKYWLFYIGRNVEPVTSLLYSTNAVIDHKYLLEKFNFKNAANYKNFSAETNVVTIPSSANGIDRLRASAYAEDAIQSVNAYKALTIEGYRFKTATKHFGWQNFGDLFWAGESYCNLHYDIPYTLLIEYIRSHNPKAFKLASEMAIFRATLGQIHGDDYDTAAKGLNFNGLAVYETTNHRDYSRQNPRYTHNWIEGIWLYYALTGNYFVGKAAKEAAEATLRFGDMHFGVAVQYNESRWVGWAVLAMLVAYKYTGEAKYLDNAKKWMLKYVALEEETNKGYFFPPNHTQIQPFLYAGYSTLGLIRLYDITGDKRLENHILRMADWVIGARGEKPVLLGGGKTADGKYTPLAAQFWWKNDADKSQAEIGLAVMNIPILIKASAIAEKNGVENKYKTVAKALIKDVAFYRDKPNAALLENDKHFVSFDSFQFPGSATKVYGQLGLFTEDAVRFLEQNS